MLLTAILIVASIPSWCADGDTFSANTVEGVSMTFKVINESEKTCQVGEGAYNSPSILQDYKGDITIPSSVNGYKVTSIGGYAFYYCSGQISITIPSSVTSIDMNAAFIGCSGLTSITVAESNTIYKR